MSNDYQIDEFEDEYGVWRENILQEFQRNGATRFEAEVLLSELEDDPLFIEGFDFCLDSALNRRWVRFSDH